MNVKVLFIVFSFLILSFKGVSQCKADYDQFMKKYDGEIQRIVNSGSVKGLSVALVEGNDIKWLKNYGYSDIANKVKTDLNTLYVIGNGVNLFKSSAIIQLDERKKLNIHDSAAKYCPDFNIKQRNVTDNPITVLDLLCHRAGLPSDLLINKYLKRALPIDSLKKILCKQYAPYPPNYIFSYSNLGYFLLTDIIENASGCSYKEYIQSNFFVPLKMNSSGFGCADSLLVSKGYNSKNQLRSNYDLCSDYQNNMIKSNIVDMAKFTMSFLTDYKGPNVLNKNSISRMLKNQYKVSPLDLNNKYGVTWKYERVNNAGQIYYHVSKSLNHRCLFAIAPVSNIAVVFLSNSVNCGQLHEIAINILDSCAVLNGKGKYEKQIEKATSLSDTIKLNSETLDKFSGYYCNSGCVFKISAQQNQLTTELMGNKFLLKPMGRNTFLAQVKLPGKKQLIDYLKFVFISYTNINLVYVHNINNGLNDVLGLKIVPQKINIVWANRIGKYELCDSDKSKFTYSPSFEIAEKDGILIISEIPKKKNIALSIKDDNAAVTLGFSSQVGHTLQFEKRENGEILWYSGLKLIRKDN